MDHQLNSSIGSPDSDSKSETASNLPARWQRLDASRSAEFEDIGPGLLLEYWDKIRRRKGTLLILCLAGFLAALVLTWSQTPIYQAHASLEIQNLNENFLNLGNVNPIANEGSSYRPEYDLQTQVKILQSENLIGAIIARPNIHQKLSRESEGGLISRWRYAMGIANPTPNFPAEKAMTFVLDKLKVNTPANTRLIDIFYDSADPQLAADVANALAEEFIRQNMESRWQATQQTGDWLTHQMEDVRIKLEKSDEVLQNYARASGLLFTSENGNAAEETLRQLQAQLSKAQSDRVTTQSKYELASTAPPDSLPEVLEDATFKDYQVKLTDLRRQLAEMATSLTAAHPLVKKLQAQVTTLESALEKERANVIQRTQNEFIADQRRENLLAENYAAHVRIMSEDSEKVTHYNILKREVDTNRQIYDSILQSVKEVGISSAQRASNIRVLDTAKPPAHSYKPHLLMNLSFGAAAGVFFGIGFILIRERADRSIHAPGESAFYLDLPELGVIPAADAEASRHFAYYKTAKRAPQNEFLNSKPKQFIELVTALRKHSVLADSFRATIASIIYSEECQGGPQVMVLTSPNPGEGKTTVATNLALAYAEMGQHVLLIDGDLRRPRLHDIFQVSNSWGLSDLLEGKRLPLGRDSKVLKTNYQGVSLLPSGSVPSNISGLLHSSRAKELLEEMKKRFEIVIIDTPPMLQIPDARVLGRSADGVILVLTSARTDRETAAAATRRLMEDGSHVLGTVLNRWDPRKANLYGPGYGFRYYWQPPTQTL